MFQKLAQFGTEFFKWLRSVYSEADGTGSSTRLHIGLLTTFIIGVGVSFAVLVHKHAITAEQFDAFLGAAAAFIAATCGPLYGVNKLADWGNRNRQQQQPPQ